MGHGGSSRRVLGTSQTLILSGFCRNRITSLHPGWRAFNVLSRDRPAVPGIPQHICNTSTGSEPTSGGSILSSILCIYSTILTKTWSEPGPETQS